MSEQKRHISVFPLRRLMRQSAAAAGGVLRKMKDPIVEEVRKHRKEHTKKFQGDLAKICADLRRIQKTSGHDVVRLAPRRQAPAARSSRRAKTHG